jgi:hypothetical protein
MILQLRYPGAQECHFQNASGRVLAVWTCPQEPTGPLRRQRYPVGLLVAEILAAPVGVAWWKPAVADTVHVLALELGALDMAYVDNPVDQIQKVEMAAVQAAAPETAEPTLAKGTLITSERRRAVGRAAEDTPGARFAQLDRLARSARYVHSAHSVRPGRPPHSDHAGSNARQSS